MISATQIDKIEDLNAVRSEWERLLASTPDASFFQSLDWLNARYPYIRDKCRLNAVIVKNDSEIIGIVPFVLKREKTRVGSIRSLSYPLSFWGSFYGPVGEATSDILDAAMAALSDGEKDWDSIDLRWVNRDGSDGGATKEAMTRRGFKPYEHIHDETSVVDIQGGDWDAYLAERGSKWRNNYKRWERRLRELGDIEYIRYRPGGESKGESDPRWDLYDECVQIASRSWQAESPDGTTLSNEKISDFLKDAHTAAARAGALDLNLLKVGTRPVAFAYNYHHAGWVSGVRIGFDPRVEKAGPGSFLYACAIRDSFERGDRIYDLGPGSLQIKRHFRTRAIPMYRYVHYRFGSPKGQLARLKHLVKRNSRDQSRALKSDS